VSYIVRPAIGHMPWLVRPYPHRDEMIAGVMIHATRAGQPGDYDDGPGTERWGNNPNNGSADQGWGTYWDELIFGSTGTQVISTDWDHEYAAWCAGYGNRGTWAAGIRYIQLEVSQSRIDQPFTAKVIDSAAQSVAKKARKYHFPIVRIPFLTQTGIPPRGICTHEDSANGRKLSKSDPGPLFPWTRFLTLAQGYLDQEEDVMTPDELARIQEIEAKLDTLEGLVASAQAQVQSLNKAIMDRLRLFYLGSGPIGDVREAITLLEDSDD